MPDRGKMRVPIYVLGNVHAREGAGYSWSCNYTGCHDHGCRLERELAWDAVADHWAAAHKGTGGKRK